MENGKQPVQVLGKIIKAGVYLLTFALPLYFLPLTNNVFEFNKQFLIITAILILLFLWGLKMVFDKKLSIRKSPFDLPLLLIILTFISATIFSQNRLVSFMGLPGVFHWNLVELISLVILYYIVSSNISGIKEIKNVVLSLSSSVFILSIINLLTYFSVIKMTFMGNLPFNPVGSPTNLTILIITTLILCTGLFFQNINKINLNKKLKTDAKIPNTKPQIQENKIFLNAFIYSFFVIILSLTFFLTSPLTSILASKITKIDYPKENFLELKASWNIAMDTFQNVPLLGSGPSTFLFDYNSFRPQYLNSTIFWDSHFNKPVNEYFLILSEVGLLGLLAFIFLAFKGIITFLKAFRFKQENSGSVFALPLLLTLIIFFIVFALTFSTTITAFIFILILAITTVSLEEIHMSEEVILSLSIFKEGVVSFGGIINEKVVLKKGGFFQTKSPVIEAKLKTEALPCIFLVFSIILSIFTGYYLTRFLIAEISYKNALDAINNNEAMKTYDNLQKAILYNPYSDLYRNTYAQTSLLLAGSIANNGNELTDQDKNNIQQLLQQSVREIRIVTENLIPQNSFNWELRAKVYRELIGIAEDAESWTIGAYNTAITLDPNNSRLRLDLGGVYFQQKNYTQAILNFQNAALLKNDYVNAYYNLSAAYRENNQPELAVTAMQQVVNLLPTDNTDYQKANNELEELKKLLPEETTESSDSANNN